jgi:hypothetical protein
VSNKQLNTLGRIRRTRNTSTYVFAVVTLGVIVSAILRDIGHLTPGLYGLILNLWTIAGIAAVVAWCTNYACVRISERDERYAWRAEQIHHSVNRLSEVMMVAEMMAAMEKDEQRIRRSNGR